ncbi:MAG: pyridoxal 5'-phosphate synthase glutaminase subunit PdxT [Thermotogota bacterium]
MIKIGILSLQGGIEEHINTLKKIDRVLPVKVKNNKQLKEIDGLIIPGGESTTLMKLIKLYGFEKEIIQFSKIKSIWGTCAGLIISSRNYLNLIDIEVQRNAFGRQSGSFVIEEKIPKISDTKIEMVFIRAPIITEFGSEVNILKKIDGKIVAAESKNVLVTSFHPELTDQLYVHKYFIEKVKMSKNQKVF